MSVIINLAKYFTNLCLQDTISADLAQRMRHTWAFFINDLQKSVHKAVFDKVLHAQEEVHEKSDILVLHELAERLMDVVQEVQGDVGEDESAIYEKDDIAAEAERVFYETLRIRQLDTRGDDSGGKDVILT